MKLEFCSLSSGSCGNATYIAAGSTRILVDAGLSAKAISTALDSIGVLPETLSAILVTHEHADHVRGVGAMSRKYRLPVYANAGTWEKMYRLVGEVPPAQRREFVTGEDFYIGDLAALPISIPHDTVDPVAFRLFSGGRSVAVATDMGNLPKRVARQLAGTDLMILESNHDIEMLQHNPRYPYRLKQRILGNHGHLSNLACAEALMVLYESGVKRALLGHLSDDNNTPELAMHAVSTALEEQGLVIGKDLLLDMTWRDRVSGYYTIE
jgi:phosphoribosyl 1,2-cyclic phosphodiesterase